MKGIYTLELNALKDCEIKVGSLGSINFKKGKYYYVGSSQTNIEKRIERHKRKDKLIHWHIDYLTTNPCFKFLKAKKFINCSKSKECELAKKYVKNYSSIKGFGCTDCKCSSHLFYKN